jgi:hypothetical protein
MKFFVYLELLEVVIELEANLISRCVGEDWLRRAVVERPAVQRQKQAVFNRCEGWKRDSHRFGPLGGPGGESANGVSARRTLLALIVTPATSRLRRALLVAGAAVSDADSPESVVLVVLQIIVLVARCSVGGVRIDVIFAGFFYNPSRRLVIVVARPYVAAERGFLFLKPGVATKC